MKALSVIETAYRATIEEQDDTIVWVSTAMKGAGADLDVLLIGNAVNYAVQKQDASGLCFGEEKQTQPPRLADDVTRLINKGATVYIVEEDSAERGIEPYELVSGLKPIGRSSLARLYEGYDQIWHW